MDPYEIFSNSSLGTDSGLSAQKLFICGDTFTDKDISGAKDYTKRSAFGRLVKAIGSNNFDPDRLTFKFRKAMDIENAKIALTSLRAQFKNVQLRQDRRNRRIIFEGGISGPVGFDGFLEDMSASRAKHFFYDIEDGFEELWPEDTLESLYEDD